MLKGQVSRGQALLDLVNRGQERVSGKELTQRCWRRSYAIFPQTRRHLYNACWGKIARESYRRKD